MELNDYYEKYDKEKEEMLNYLETDFDELFKDDEKEIEEVKKIWHWKSSRNWKSNKY